MTIKDFIEKAIEGGWEKGHEKYTVLMNISEFHLLVVDGDKSQTISFTRIILDPKAWKAVGVIDGWDIGWQCDECGKRHVCDGENCMEGGTHPFGCYRKEMHKMIDALIEGKSLEEYIATL